MAANVLRPLHGDQPLEQNITMGNGFIKQTSISMIAIVLMTLSVIFLIQSFLFHAHVSCVFLGCALSLLLISVILCIIIKFKKDAGETIALAQVKDIRDYKKRIINLRRTDQVILDKFESTLATSLDISGSSDTKTLTSSYDTNPSNMQVSRAMRTHELFPMRSKIAKISDINDQCRTHYDDNIATLYLYNIRTIKGQNIHGEDFVYDESSIETIKYKQKSSFKDEDLQESKS